ncbi:MAG: DUF1634 domain-containing protein [bacterium]
MSDLNDEDVEQSVGRLLQLGVGISALVVLAGGIALLSRHGFQPVAFHDQAQIASPLWSVHGILRGAVALDSSAVIQLGLVLLILTPVARVAFSLIAFARQRDGLYVAITSVVLALLLFGFAWGRA